MAWKNILQLRKYISLQLQMNKFNDQTRAKSFVKLLLTEST